MKRIGTCAVHRSREIDMPRAIEPDSHERHRSVPIKETITRIPGYPSKLVIFKIPAASYWWVRYYAESHIFVPADRDLTSLRA